MNDKNNMVKFVSCTQEEYDNRDKNNEELKDENQDNKGENI